MFGSLSPFQDGLSASKEHWLHVSAGRMEFRTLLHRDMQGCVQSLGSDRVHLPADLAGQSPAGAAAQGPCYVSQLMLFKENPFPGGPAPGQVQYGRWWPMTNDQRAVVML